MNNLAQLPGFLEEWERESRAYQDGRDAIWASDPTEEIAEGITLQPLTLRGLNDLSLSRNPFILGGEPDPGDIAALIWRQNEAYSPRNRPGNDLLERIAALTYSDIVPALYRWVGEQFRDDPTDGPIGDRKPAVSGYGYIATMVDILCSEYHMDPDRVMAMPLRQAHQLMRCIFRRKNRDYKAPDPMRELKRKGLRRMREEGRNGG